MNESFDKINNFLRHFSKFTGSPLLALNEKGVCAFNYDNTFDITLELPDSSAQLYLYSSVMNLPAEGKLEIYENLLKLNAYCIETHGATLALDEHGSVILLCYLYPLNALDEITFVNIFNNFVSTLQDLRAKLTRYNQSINPALFPVTDTHHAPEWLSLSNRV